MSAIDEAQGTAGESTLRNFLRVLRRRLPVAVIATVMVPSAALAFSLQAEKQYTATAQLLFREPGFDQKLFGSPVLGPSEDPAREAATNVKLVALSAITARAERVLERPRAEFDKKIKVLAEGQSNVVSVAATDRNPTFAATLANTIADEYIRFRRDADRSKINEGVDLLRGKLEALRPSARSGAQGRSISRQIEQLQLLAALQTGNAELVQPAERPDQPSSPRPFRNTILGLIVGLAIAMLLVIGLDRLDRRLRHRSDAQQIFNRPVLATIPESRALRRHRQGALRLSGAESDAFRALRTNLRYFAVDQQIHSLVVTSTAPGEGKSTITRYLAATAAASNVRVLLLEADLRRPTLAAEFPELRGQGLTDVLAGNVPMSEVVQRLPLEIGGGRVGDAALDVVTSGPLPPNPADLLESERMREVVHEAERQYDLVIIDTSPVTVVPDAIPLLGLVSGVVVIIREGRSTRTRARQLRTLLDNLAISPLGIVINGVAVGDDDAYRAYYSANEALGDIPQANGSRLRQRSGRRREETAGSSRESGTGP